MNILINLQNKITDVAALHRVAGESLYAAVMRNFQNESAGLGGPKWQPLSRATIKERERVGKWPGRILQRSGFRAGLKGSIFITTNQNQATVGSNLGYAGIHQFGGIIERNPRSEIFIRARNKTGQFKKSKKNIPGKGFTFKGYSIRIPARPFLIITDLDKALIKDDIQRFITKGL